jgi:hypothetical protein
MAGVLALPLAVLLHIDAFTIVHLVLHRDVVTALAGFASQGDLNAFFVLCHITQLTSGFW